MSSIVSGLAIVGLVAAASPARAETTTLILSAEADARVEADAPDTNFGESSRLLVDGEPVEMESVLRFDVPEVDGTVIDAKLRLYAFDPSFDGPAVYRTDTAWSETGVTWNARPERIGGPVDDAGAVADEEWFELDVTAALTGTGSHSFLLVPTSWDGMDTYSRNADALNPELVVTVFKDTTPPSVVGVSPSPATEVDAASPNISVTFDEPMDTGATESAFSLEAGDGGPVAGSFSWSGTTLTFAPTHALAPGAEYTAKLTRGARDVAGNSLAEDHAWSFRTKPHYYVSFTGSDDNSGASPEDAWRTVDKVNNFSFEPGATVFFEGGEVFSDKPLTLDRSGAAGAPITFTSYGSGKANLREGIWFDEEHHLSFVRLAVGRASRDEADGVGLQAGTGGAGSSDITIRACSFFNVAIAIHSGNPADAHWTIEDNSIEYTRDSAVITRGHDQLIQRNTILESGADATIPFGKHGIYVNGPANVVRDNVIRGFSSNGVSLRYHDTLVEGNDIRNGPIAIAFFTRSATAGTTRVLYNAIGGTSASIYVDDFSSVGGPTAESFLIANNTMTPGGGIGVHVAGTSGSVTVANNVVVGADRAALVLGAIDGTYSEHHNLWWNGPGGVVNFALARTWYDLVGYQLASGQGTADLLLDPLLGDDFVPAAASPAVDAGTTSVHPLLAYTAVCSGKRFDYCGLAPDLGARETR